MYRERNGVVAHTLLVCDKGKDEHNVYLFYLKEIKKIHTLDELEAGTKNGDIIKQGTFSRDMRIIKAQERLKFNLDTEKYIKGEISIDVFEHAEQRAFEFLGLYDKELLKQEKETRKEYTETPQFYKDKSVFWIIKYRAMAKKTEKENAQNGNTTLPIFNK